MASNNENNQTSSNSTRRRQYSRHKKNTGTATSTNTPKLIRELKFHMHDSDQRKMSESFHKIKEAIVTKIKSTFQNPLKIAESITSMRLSTFSEPVLTESVKIDANEKALENRQLEMKYKIMFERHIKKEEVFEENLVRAYALIWDTYCSREVQVAIKEMPDFDTQIVNQPVELLSRVENLVHTPMKAKYPPLTLVEVLISFLQISQADDESLLDYLSRFKSEQSVMLRLVGRRLLNGYTENTPQYKALADTDNSGQDFLKKQELN